MTGPRPGLRVRDIAPEYATLLRRVHQLAAEATRLRQTNDTADPNATPSTQVLAQIAAIDRDRDLTEIHARASGMPASWVDLARRLGHTGQAWTDDHLLPTLRPVAGRRSAQRVLDDIRQLADMAAITVVREHLLATGGIAGEPDPVAAQQLRRNMQALWTRATATATSIRMSRTDRAHAFEAAVGDVDTNVERYRHYRLDDLDAQWRTYTTPAIADGVRRSLKSLRRTNRAANSSDAESETTPTPSVLLDHARHALDTASTDQSEAGAAIGTAVTAAMPDAATHRWDTGTHVRDSEFTGVEAYPEAGPDP
ncbi:hypothetical protein IU450_28300 [Nocardia abscessus]|uniref:hypothetical protein n=1 Tax=Nocardia abscessus TaxID=120957 RepID=UPI001893DF0E|nr:hypothetical protein [Nocardia abscessus]MBF6339761.1 hypothetical protein [Nocardia abscessus]